MSRVVQVFLNADMRNSHEGLEHLALKHKINLGKLKPGEFVVFINAHKDRLKLYAANHVYAYLRVPKGEKLDLRTIQLIPESFQATGRIQYEENLRKVIQDFLKKKGSHELKAVA